MKNLVYALVILFVCGLLYSLPQNESLSLNLAQSNCCNPPLHGPEVPRFPQNTQVNVFIDAGSGFTESETDLITEGIADWNNEPNNSRVTYNIQVVKTSSLPPAGTNNTIIVQYRNVVSTGTGGALLNMHRNSNGAIFGEMFLFKNIRDPGPASQPGQIRATARHEIAHGIGLDNALNCPLGSTIMNPAWDAETLITSCDNAVINSDPSYPVPTPTPTPTPCAELHVTCFYNSDCCSTVCGEISYRCIPCEFDHEGSCMTEHCYNCQQYQAECDEWGQCYTPVVIDVLGNGIRLTNAADGVDFDIDNNPNTANHLAWTQQGSDDAWLVLDRDGNGSIDNGPELFGDRSPQPVATEPNGFIALAEYDKPTNGGNDDGKINHSDAIFPTLRLWQDVNHNGISEASELKTLSQLGLGSIELDYKISRKADEHGNQFRYRAKVRDAQGAHLGHWAWDVFLVTAP